MQLYVELVINVLYANNRLYCFVSLWSLLFQLQMRYLILFFEIFLSAASDPLVRY